ncbi:MAG: hypothetical protein NVS1B13_14890 [Flavisolibacter sp.]
MTSLLGQASILDVRSEEEFSLEHYPGAINIPLNQLLEHIAEIKAMKQPIITYCRSGSRSGIATTMLKQHGIIEVYNGGALEDLLKLSN